MPSAADREIRRQILKFLRKIETAWLGGQIEELRDCFREDAVLLGPDLEHRLEGRDPIVDSYAQFLEEARLLAFESEAPIVDVFGDSAVTVTPWTVEYEREGTLHREAGGDLLVLAREGDGWKVAWRTLLPREVPDRGGRGAR
ncbi:MAG: YybH family protein [Gemmatimonadota bacterium]